MIKDEKIGKPVPCIQIAEERDMDEEECRVAGEDEKGKPVSSRKMKGFYE